MEDIRRVRTISPRQALTFATTEGDIRAVRARLVTVDSEMSLTVGPGSTDEVSVEVRTTTRVPLSACENVVFRRGDSVASAQLEGGRAQFPLATLSRVFNVSSRETTAARFCGRVLRIGIAEAQLFSRLEENIPRIGSADTSGGEETDDEQSNELVQATANQLSTAIRARLEAESPTLHACAGRAGPLRVLAAWNEEGVVTVTLDGEGAAINECIQAGIPWATLDVQGAGSLIHVVREPTPDGI